MRGRRAMPVAVSVLALAIAAVGLSCAPAFAIAPNDPSFGLQWADENLGQTIWLQNQEEEKLGEAPGTPGADDGAALAWGITTGSRSVVVAVIDTGVDWHQGDLAANIWTNPGGVGGCPAGTHGFNVIAKLLEDPCNPDDTDTTYGGHGTHVAGIIGAVGNNGFGVAGINWQTTLLPVRWLKTAEKEEEVKYLAAGLRKVAQLRREGLVNIRVVNDSATFGGELPPEAELNELRGAIEELGAAGILFVSAAGNTEKNDDAEPRYPCSFRLPNQICVTATDDNDQRPAWANWGRETVDLAAPGVSIYSTLREGSPPFRYLTGTSMATAQVSGAAALILSAEPALSVGQLKADILEHVDPLPSLAGKVATSGRLDVCRAIPGCPPAPPTAATGGAIAITASSATVTGSTDPNAQPTACRFEYGPTAAYGASAPCTPPPGAGLAPVAVAAGLGGLVPASTYHYRLVAANATGTSYGADQTFSTLAPAPPPGGGKPPVPEVRVVSSTLWASTRGVLTVKLRCPASAGTCKGTIAIRSPYRRRTRTLLYAHGSFTIAGGHVLSLRLHLSRRARSLLAHHHHRLGAVVVISARDPAGGTFGRHLAVTIRLLSPRRR